jgi:biliverdin reductase
MVLGVGLVGTGFVATKRADAIATDARAQLVAVTGYGWDETVAFAQQHHAKPMAHWSTLVADEEVDLVMVCHINQGHGRVTQAALAAGKSVVVEYPLALRVEEANQLMALAQEQRILLHVAHVELLSGSHVALRQHLPELGTVHYARYCTLTPKQNRPNHWTYKPALFGFPLVGAQSRIHRLVNCWGPVERVYCQNRYVNLHPHQSQVASHQGCLCVAQLSFASGTVAEVIYGKGNTIWQPSRRLEVMGTSGGLVFDGNQAERLTAEGSYPVAVGSRRGLFAEDTKRVLDYLVEGTPLYCSVEESLYSLGVASAAEQSALIGQAVTLI